MNEGNWEVEDVGGQPSKGLNIPHRTPVQGSYGLNVVDDEEKGKCLELELVPEGELWPLMYEHTWIKTQTPQEIARDGKEALGVWIKGNSSGGDVVMEISGTDNKKTQIRPDPILSSYIDFDGWNFVRFTLPTGPEWNDSFIFHRFLISTPRQVLYGTEFVPVGNLKIRLKDLSLL